MGYLSKDSQAWHMGTLKVFTLWFLALICWAVISMLLAEAFPDTVETISYQIGFSTMIGGFFGLALFIVIDRIVRKGKYCPRLECGGKMVKILATGQYICQVCGGNKTEETD